MMKLTELLRITRNLGTHSCEIAFWKKLQGNYKEITRILQGNYKEITRKLQRNYKEITRNLQGIYKEITRNL